MSCRFEDPRFSIGVAASPALHRGDRLSLRVEVVEDEIKAVSNALDFFVGDHTIKYHATIERKVLNFAYLLRLLLRGDDPPPLPIAGVPCRQVMRTQMPLTVSPHHKTAAFRRHVEHLHKGTRGERLGGPVES